MIRINKSTIPVALALIALVSSALYAKDAKKGRGAGSNVKVETVKKSEKKADTTGKKIASGHKLVENLAGEPVFRAKTLENSVGAVKILMKGSVGSFQLYALNQDDAAIPLLSGNDEFTSSFFSLKVGKNEYRLTDASGVVVGARKTKTGGQMVYVVPEVAKVLVGFDVIQSEPKKDPDVIKVTIEVINRGKRYNSFYLKQVLDTVLGEKLGPHFSTAEDLALNSEIQVRRFDKIKYIYSGSPKAAMCVLLHGADITKPEVVSLGNKDFLALPAWVPETVTARTFDSVLSYNNSAICLNWEPLELGPEESGKIVYYIMTATGDRKIDSDAFIGKIEKQLKKEAEENEDINGSEEKINVQPEKQDETEVPNEPGEEIVPMEKDVDDESLSKKPSIPFNVDTIGPEKLDPSYVQALLDKINSLESDASSVDREEILQLNAELDAIMNKLRQQ